MSDKAQAGSIGPGTVIEVPSSDLSYAPTAEQIAAREQVMAAKSMHLAPSLGPHTTAADVARPGGPPTDGLLQQLPTDFTVFKTSLINSICPGCGESTVNEPSAANSGGRVVETSNWNIAYTTNGGAATVTWKNQSPYAISSGYCCDTQVVYDKDRDVFILMLLDYAGEGASTNGLTISISKGLFPATGPNWCTYKFKGSNFGEGANDTLDFAKIALSNNNLFLTWNDYPPNSGFAASGLARFPLDALATCAGFGYTYLTRNTEFTFALPQQPSVHDQFYWVSNWMLDGTVNGNNLRIFRWADNSGTYFFNTIAINPYTFGNAACGTPNWCSRLDPRYESVVITPAEYRAQANGAFAGDQILEVATSAGPSGFSNGKNYVVYNYFKLNSLTYLGNDQTYSTSVNFAYPGCAVNERGYVGCALAQGTNAPGGIIILQDDVNPTQPWGYNFVVGGISGASAWGDYNVTNPWHPSGGPFQTVLWNVNGSTVQPYYIVWGRAREKNDYTRWKSK
ncbi:MAG: hypothetical protein DMG80_11440 [Acidobacteria bacterium]|nr:MAG: hypothetical protein DMG80_11440 [Acidobacteriota bacterium]